MERQEIDMLNIMEVNLMGIGEIADLCEKDGLAIEINNGQIVKIIKES